MRALSAQEMLNVWERGTTQVPLVRALTLLAAASPEMSDEALWELSIGERNARLLTLREWMFGSRFTGTATCPRCGERLELDFDAAELRSQPRTVARELSARIDEYHVQFRLPTSQDVLTVADESNAELARQALLANCITSVETSGKQIAEKTLPALVVDAIAEQMAMLDPQANVELALTCPNCNHAWRAVFDIVTYFWSEINTWALRILRDVHILARAYGWREADSLALSPQRRQIYLNLVGA
jgi:uncharacterized protein (UPF0212 family)